jgi:hypothetical protein
VELLNLTGQHTADSYALVHFLESQGHHKANCGLEQVYAREFLFFCVCLTASLMQA